MYISQKLTDVAFSVASVVSVFVEAAFHPKVYPIYEEALLRSLHNMQDKIPHEDLAIQLGTSVRYQTPLSHALGGRL